MSSTQSLVRTRIAPSPTGMPHIGTVFQALFDWVIARQSQGKFVVRIEDTDQSRKVEGAEEAIYTALDWFGLSPDESPRDGGEFGPYRQSERLEIYQKFAQELVDQGKAYYCFCSAKRLERVRRERQKQGLPPMYDQCCRELDPDEAAKKAKSEAHVIRMKVPKGRVIKFVDEIRGEISFESGNVDDQVIVKSDGFPTYHLAVVVDDHLMEITHMIRGEEWISSTPKHVLLYEHLGWKQPKMIHTPLLRNPDKSKLSKRHGHAEVEWYRKEGFLPEATLNFLASRVWNHPQGKEIFSLAELVDRFELEKMHVQGPIVDLDKLRWYNGQYIRRLSEAELLERVREYKSEELEEEKLKKILPEIKERLVTLAQVRELTEYIYKYELPQTKLVLKRSDKSEVSTQLEQTVEKLEKLKQWQTTEIERVIRELQENNEWHRGQYFMLLRVAATGKTATPPLFESMGVIGQDEVVARLKRVKGMVS